MLEWHKICVLNLEAENHYDDVQWPSWGLELPVNRVFVQQFVQTDNKETSKVHVTVPLWGEFTGHRWIPRTKVQ